MHFTSPVFPSSDRQLNEVLERVSTQNRDMESELTQIGVCLGEEYERRLELWTQLSAELLTEEPAAYERVKRLLSDLRDAL